MKRKIALLLAVVMLVGVALPANLFAGSTIYLDGGVFSTYDNYSLSVAPDINVPQNSTWVTANLPSSGHGPYDGAPVAGRIANNSRGSSLVLTFNGVANYNQDQSFFIDLTNARWGFVNSASGIVTGQAGITSNYNRDWLKEISSSTETTGAFNASGQTGWIRRLRVDNQVGAGTGQGADMLTTEPSTFTALIKGAIGNAIDEVKAELTSAAPTEVTVADLRALGTSTFAAYFAAKWDGRNNAAEHPALVAVATTFWTNGFNAVMNNLGLADGDNWTTTVKFVDPTIVIAATSITVPDPLTNNPITAGVVTAINSAIDALKGLGIFGTSYAKLDAAVGLMNWDDPLAGPAIAKIEEVIAESQKFLANELTDYNAGEIFDALTNWNFGITNGSVIPALSANRGAGDLFYANAATNSPYQTMVRKMLGTTNSTTDTKKGIEYTLDVSNSSYTQAMITIPGGQNIQNGDVLVIPLCVRSITNAEMSLTINGSGSIVSSLSAYVIGNGGASSGTNVTTTPVSAARGRIHLNPISFTERSNGRIVEGSFTMIAPEGFEWITTGAYVTSNSPINYPTGITKANWEDFIKMSASGRTLTVTMLADFPSSSTAPGTLNLIGLVLAPTVSNPNLINYGDLYIEINGGAGISPRTNTNGNPLKVAVRSDWNIGFNADDEPVTLYSGRRNTNYNHKDLGGRTQEATTIVMNENVYNSWNAMKETIFTLCDADGNTLEGVKMTYSRVYTESMYDVYGDEFYAHDRGLDDSYNGLFENKDVNGNYSALKQMPYKHGYFTEDGHSFVMTDIEIPIDELGYAELTFALTAEPNFEGDVYVKVTGNALADNYYYDTIENEGIVQIATFIPAVTAEAKVSSIEIGFQRYDVDTVVITENYDADLGAGLIANNKLQLAIGEYGNGRLSNYMYFTPITKDDYTVEGDKTFNLSNPMYNGGNYLSYERVIEFTVVRASSQFGATITLTNLQINIDRGVPQGEYDFLVGGRAFVQNWQDEYTAAYNYDLFDIWGVIVKDYIKVATPGANVPFKQTVEVWAGSDVALVNGVEFQMEVPVLNVDGRLFIPIRFVAVALGVDDSSITFDDISRKVVIFTAEKIVTFTQDSSVYTVNGTEMNMAENGVISKMFIDEKTGRSYIPFRYLAYAFQIPVSYDEATGIATYNPK